MISLCMIVKDEEKYIRNCLSSISNYVDEIIITDTGSTDSTRDICKEFGTLIYDYKLDGDFSGARNFCISKARNDFILVLDADEYLDDESCKTLKSCVKHMKSCQLKGMHLTRYDYFFTGGWSEALILRLFMNSDDIKYIGKVYESVRVDKSQLYTVDAPNININHLGFLKKQKDMEKKRNMYKSIIQNDKNVVKSNKLYYWLAQDLFINNECEEAVKILKKYLSHNTESKRIYELLGKIYMYIGLFDEASCALRKVFHLSQNERELMGFLHSQFYLRALNNYAELCYLQGDVKAALEHYKKVLDISDSAYLNVNLGFTYQKIGMYSNALTHYNKAMSINGELIMFDYSHDDKYGRLSNTSIDFKGLKENIEYCNARLV